MLSWFRPQLWGYLFWHLNLFLPLQKCPLFDRYMMQKSLELFLTQQHPQPPFDVLKK